MSLNFAATIHAIVEKDLDNFVVTHTEAIGYKFSHRQLDLKVYKHNKIPRAYLDAENLVVNLKPETWELLNSLVKTSASVIKAQLQYYLENL